MCDISIEIDPFAGLLSIIAIFLSLYTIRKQSRDQKAQILLESIRQIQKKSLDYWIQNTTSDDKKHLYEDLVRHLRELEYGLSWMNITDAGNDMKELWNAVTDDGANSAQKDKPDGSRDKIKLIQLSSQRIAVRVMGERPR